MHSLPKYEPVYRSLASGRVRIEYEHFQCPPILCQGKVVEFTVPIGFECDLASVPRGFRNIVSKHGKHNPAAIAHDYLYATGQVNRKVADIYFREFLKMVKVPKWLASLMYRAVRIGGKKAYQRHKAKRAAKRETRRIAQALLASSPRLEPGEPIPVKPKWNETLSEKEKKDIRDCTVRWAASLANKEEGAVSPAQKESGKAATPKASSATSSGSSPSTTALSLLLLFALPLAGGCSTLGLDLDLLKTKTIYNTDGTVQSVEKLDTEQIALLIEVIQQGAQAFNDQQVVALDIKYRKKLQEIELAEREGTLRERKAEETKEKLQLILDSIEKIKEERVVSSTEPEGE